MGSDSRRRASTARRLSLAIAAVLTVGCARLPFEPTPVAELPLEARAAERQDGDIRIRMTLLEPDEASALLGVDLIEQGIQPLWLEVTNRGDSAARLALASIDRDYYPPLEVAWMSRKSFARKDRPALERWLHDNRVGRRIPAGTTRSGLIFVDADVGTREFSADVFADDGARHFTFLLRADGDGRRELDADPTAHYPPGELTRVGRQDEEGLASALSRAACCIAGPGAANGPGNIVLIGAATAVQRALIRAGWTDAAPIEASATPALVYAGRGPDAVFTKLRQDRAVGHTLVLWLAPVQAGTDPVWLARATLGETEFPGMATEAGRNSLLQDLWYAQSIAGIAVLPDTVLTGDGSGSPNGSPARPETLVLIVADESVAMSDTDFLNLRQTAR